MSSSSEPNSRMDEAKAIITLRSGKELKQPAPEAEKKGQEVLTGSEYVHKFITQLPKDYYLIPGKLYHKTC